MGKDNPTSPFLPIFQLLWQHKKTLLWTIILSGIGGIGISFLLPVYFLSSATIYPAEITYVESTDLLYRRGNLNDYGDIQEAEQILEMLESTDFKLKIVDSFALFDHYNIDPNSNDPVYQVLTKYKNQIKAKRTRFNAIKISVEDKDPALASAMVNGILIHLNKFMNTVVTTRMKSHYTHSLQTRDSLQTVFLTLQDSLQKLQQKGLVSKVERAALFEAAGNIRGNQPELQKLIQHNKAFGNQYDILENEVFFIQGQIQTLDKILLQLSSNLYKDIAQIFIFEKGQVPDHKSKPKRLYVVMATVLLSIFLIIGYIFWRQFWPQIVQQLEISSNAKHG